jgi:hypothetical protein
MSTTMDQVVKKAKDSFGPIFDKSLHDLVRGIRNHKENEVCMNNKIRHAACCFRFFNNNERKKKKKRKDG